MVKTQCWIESHPAEPGARESSHAVRIKNLDAVIDESSVSMRSAAKSVRSPTRSKRSRHGELQIRPSAARRRYHRHHGEMKRISAGQGAWRTDSELENASSNSCLRSEYPA
jgi:hypothetical protein